jgi:hypothetical protein
MPRCRCRPSNNFRDAESAGKHYNTYFKPFFRQAA